MPLTYPAPPPTLSGDLETINRFLQSPTLITRRLRTLLEQRFIADALLTARYPATGGAVLYEQSEPIFADRAVQAVMPGSEYGLSGVGTGTAQIAGVVKWGQDAIVTDEAIKRLNNDPVNRALIKLVNNMVKQVDSVALAAISSQVTQHTANSASWGTVTTNIPLDVYKAVASINALNQGYDPDTLVVDDATYANLMGNTAVQTAMRRENPDNPVYTGQIPVLGGLRILVSPNLPTANKALVLDSKVLGGMADEDLGGPGYSGQAKGVEGKSIRDDDKDSWRLRARRVTVPVVIEPAAAWKIDLS